EHAQLVGGVLGEVRVAAVQEVGDAEAAALVRGAAQADAADLQAQATGAADHIGGRADVEVLARGRILQQVLRVDLLPRAARERVQLERAGGEVVGDLGLRTPVLRSPPVDADGGGGVVV